MMLLCAGVTALIGQRLGRRAGSRGGDGGAALARESAQLLIPLARGFAHRRRL
jgi:hypothetical protein